MNNHTYGNKGEAVAKEFIENKGFAIVEQNYRYSRYGEIDIIGVKGNLIVFFEIKSRHTNAYGTPQQAITHKKIKALRAVASYFLQQHPDYNNKAYTMRFDCIAIMGQSVEWLQDIIR